MPRTLKKQIFFFFFQRTLILTQSLRIVNSFELSFFFKKGYNNNND